MVKISAPDQISIILHPFLFTRVPRFMRTKNVVLALTERSMREENVAGARGIVPAAASSICSA